MSEEFLDAMSPGTRRVYKAGLGEPPPGICHNCGAKYDHESFRVKVGDSGPYMSFLCRKCAKEDGAEIIELSVNGEKTKKEG